MPNGNGQLDCSYCIHFQSKYGELDVAVYEEGFCKFYKTEIPSTLPTWNHRICSDIELNKHFEKYLKYYSLKQRFEWFGIELEKNVLYEFHYNSPNIIKKLKDL